MNKIIHKQVNCNSCLNYSTCRNIEAKYRDALLENEGNWRAIFQDGKRIGTPIRRCSHSIVKTYLNRFHNKTMLEIGCGPQSEIDYNFCRNNTIQYVGIDPERLPPLYIPGTRGKSIQDKLFTGALRFFRSTRHPHRNSHQRYILDAFPSRHLKAETFDLIYGNSTVEHWHQHQKDLERSLELYKADFRQCYKLLKPGGALLINCPIFVHGNRIFMEGRIDLIEDFLEDQWSSVVIEHWRQQHDDLMPYCP